VEACSAAFVKEVFSLNNDLLLSIHGHRDILYIKDYKEVHVSIQVWRQKKKKQTRRQKNEVYSLEYNFRHGNKSK